MKNSSKSLSRKKIVSVLFGVFLIALLSGGIGYSLAGKSWIPPNIALDDFPSIANYVIKADTMSDPTTYYAVASNGSIVSISLVCSDVVNSVIGDNRTIQFASGLFQLTKSLQVNKTQNLVLTGSDASSRLIMGTGSQSASFQVPIILVNNSRAINIEHLYLNHSYLMSFFPSRDINAFIIQALNTTNLDIGYNEITGAGDYAIGIGVQAHYVATTQYPCNNTKVHDNYVHDTPVDGINVYGGFNHQIYANRFETLGDDALGTSLAGMPINTLSFTNNIVDNSKSPSNALPNGVKITTGAISGAAMVATDTLKNIIIANNIIKTSGSGIWMWVAPSDYQNYVVGTVFASNITITGNTILNTTMPAIYGEASRTGCLITGLTINGNTIGYSGWSNPSGHASGIELYFVKGSTISCNTLSSTGDSGYAALLFGNCTDCTITTNTIENSRGAGIMEINGTSNVFISNHLTNSAQQGFTQGSTFCTNNGDEISYNYIKASGSTGSGNKNDNMMIYGTSQTLKGNTIISYSGTLGASTIPANLRYGIYIRSGCTDIKLLNNDAEYGGYTQDKSILDLGTNTLCHSCINGTSWIT